MRRNTLLIAFGLLLAVVAAATIAVVSGDGGDQPPESRGPRALNLPDEPAWTVDADLMGAPQLDVRDGAFLYRDDQISLMDAATGEPRWGPGPVPLDERTTREFVPKPELVTGDDGIAVLAPEVDCAGCAPDPTAGVLTFGLRLLSGEDGSELWHVDVVPPSGSTLTGTAVAGDGIALLTFAGKDLLPHTIAFDLRDGTQRWAVDGSSPFAVAGDVVLMYASKHQLSVDPGIGALREGQVVGVDAATGEPLWDLADRYERSELLLVAGDVALVRGAAEGRRHPRAELVSVADGSRLDELGYGVYDGCGTDGRTVIACPRDGDLWTYHVADARTALYTADVEITHVDAVWPELLAVTAGPDHHTIDYTGALVDRDLPGRVLGRGEDHVLLETEVEDGLPIIGGYPVRR